MEGGMKGRMEGRTNASKETVGGRPQGMRVETWREGVSAWRNDRIQKMESGIDSGRQGGGERLQDIRTNKQNDSKGCRQIQRQIGRHTESGRQRLFFVVGTWEGSIGPMYTYTMLFGSLIIQRRSFVDLFDQPENIRILPLSTQRHNEIKKSLNKLINSNLRLRRRFIG